MKERIKNIILSPSVLIACLLVLLIAVSFNSKGTTANNSTYPPDDVIENFASVVASEIGCADSKDHFVYEMIWVGTFINQYNFWKEGSKKQSTVVFNTENMCSLLSLGQLYSPNYCYYTWAKRAANRGGDCTQAQKDQMNLAVKMVLTKSFNIPRNVYYAAEAAYANTSNNVVWADFQPTVNGKSVGMRMYYSTQNKEQPKAEDVYGNAITTDLNFYKNLANCLYEHPTLFGAYNKCDGSSPVEPTKYTVYLYPNGGTGITEGQIFEYTDTADFSTFPKVTKANCKLDGWNIGSPTGKEYYQNVDSTDNGKKLYARWDCEANNSSSNESDKYTVTFKLEKDTTKVFEEKKVTTGKKVSPPTNEPTKENYVLQGWETDDGEVFNFNNKITKDLTLYAIWQKKTSTVPKTEEPKPSSSIPTTPKPTESQSKEDVNNPGTGLADYIIIVLLIIPTLLGVIYYYKYYIKSNRKS